MMNKTSKSSWRELVTDDFTNDSSFEDEASFLTRITLSYLNPVLQRGYDCWKNKINMELFANNRKIINEMNKKNLLVVHIYIGTTSTLYGSVHAAVMMRRSKGCLHCPQLTFSAEKT